MHYDKDSKTVALTLDEALSVARLARLGHLYSMREGKDEACVVDFHVLVSAEEYRSEEG